MKEPTVRVGILSARGVRVRFNGPFTDSAAATPISGLVTIGARDLDASGGERLFSPAEGNADAWFELEDVTIGIGFHWERRETQRFAGSLLLIPTPGSPGSLTAINLIGAEEYLTSVISSEMSARASAPLLKAHAVISRSWLMAMLGRGGGGGAGVTGPDDRTEGPEERVMWWDRDDHEGFDVCADDHCQRYQGLTRVSPAAAAAVAATRGEVLTHAGAICDARFSKCCGGAFEEFENCWAPVHHPYLAAGRDTGAPLPCPDLTVESNARRWILSTPPAYCNTTDTAVLDQVLNGYDRETPDFYRWRVDYTGAELAEIVRSRTGFDPGEVIDLVAEARGTSGRISRLTITGTNGRLTIGKELAIRRALSRSHLYSSAFTVERHDPDSRGVPREFTLHGAGWGHGVGLCQIGAAMMGAQGIPYNDILLHYYRGATIDRLYE